MKWFSNNFSRDDRFVKASTSINSSPSSLRSRVSGLCCISETVELEQAVFRLRLRRDDDVCSCFRGTRPSHLRVMTYSHVTAASLQRVQAGRFSSHFCRRCLQRVQPWWERGMLVFTISMNVLGNELARLVILKNVYRNIDGMLKWRPYIRIYVWGRLSTAYLCPIMDCHGIKFICIN
jgi:hypothetical protein